MSHVINKKNEINDIVSVCAVIVGKMGQGMRCCKCNSNSNGLVCETQGEA
jgi:hypothetical protein